MNQKSAFWEALIITIFVFGIGIMIGISYEGNKLEEINNYYALSEISMVDSLALNSLSDTGIATCSSLTNSSLVFADRIYEEAFLLEKFEESGKFSDSLKISHRKYDLLRTLLWTNLIKISEKCPEAPDVVVYLYEYNTEDLAKKATNLVWSRILFDLKQEEGNKIVLIPIAADSNLASLDSIKQRYGINHYPTVVINQKQIITQITSVDDLKIYLK